MWLMCSFLVTFLEGGGTVCMHMSHVQLPYMVINVKDGGGGGILNFGKLGKFGKQVVGNISDYIVSHE